jgi:hypothetical protein
MKIIVKESQLDGMKDKMRVIPFDYVNYDWNIVKKLSKGKPFILKGNLLGDQIPKDDTSLGSLFEITGHLHLEQTNISSLGMLTKVGKSLNIRYCDIEDINNLAHVGGNFDFSGTKIKSLNNLNTVEGHLHCSSYLEDFGELTKIGTFLNAPSCNITSLDKIESVGGYLDVSYTFIESFGNLKSVYGDLYIRDTELSDMYSEDEIRKNIYVIGQIHF